MDPAVSVIIPVGPGESEHIGLLEQLNRYDSFKEIILCLPYDEDLTIDAQNIAVVRSERGRAKQLNAGIKVASGEYLWLLHADTRLRDHSIDSLKEALQRYPDSLLYFDIIFRDGPALTWLNQQGAWLRSRFLTLPYGDQGFCLKRSIAETLDGFNEKVPIAEDFYFIREAMNQGVQIAPTGGTLSTSARKYRQHGWLQTTTNHLITTYQLIRESKPLKKV